MLQLHQNWAGEFTRGRESLEDNPRCERSETSTKEENIDRAYHMMVDDKRMSIKQIDKTVSIFPE